MSAIMRESEVVKSQAEQIVASGVDIRPRLSEVVSQAAVQSQPSSLLELARAVLDGAREGLEKSVPKDPDDVLRQVIDALGDGLSRTALAAQLAVQEAAGSSRQFAQEDLARLRDDLKAVQSLLGETVARALRSGKAMTTAQMHNAVTHAGRVSERLGPVFASVLAAVRQHPILLAREGFQAGLGAGQCAAGALFQSIGRMLQRAGDELRKGSRADQ